MRRSDDVFFFTLIDFLLQVFFFGLLLFVVGQLLQQQQEAQREKDEAALNGLLKATGVSNITELTDFLSKLAPLDRLRGTKDFIEKNGGMKSVEAAVAAARAAGGIDKVSGLQQQVEAMSSRIAHLEGWGKASCIPNIMVNGKLQPKSIARVVVQDDSITLEEPGPEMTKLLSSLGLEFNAVQKLSLSAFRSTFSPIVARQPECRYFLNVVTRTQYLEPMRVVWSAFRTQ
jgi:hypothetical protein